MDAHRVTDLRYNFEVIFSYIISPCGTKLGLLNLRTLSTTSTVCARNCDPHMQKYQTDNFCYFFGFNRMVDNSKNKACAQYQGS
jgi:hypothetical protein